MNIYIHSYDNPMHTLRCTLASWCYRTRQNVTLRPKRRTTRANMTILNYSISLAITIDVVCIYIYVFFCIHTYIHTYSFE